MKMQLLLQNQDRHITLLIIYVSFPLPQYIENPIYGPVRCVMYYIIMQHLMMLLRMSRWQDLQTEEHAVEGEHENKK